MIQKQLHSDTNGVKLYSIFSDSGKYLKHKDSDELHIEFIIPEDIKVEDYQETLVDIENHIITPTLETNII